MEKKNLIVLQFMKNKENFIMNYVESKKVLDKIASKYGCEGDVIMRTAAQYIVEYGQYMFNDEGFIKDQIQQIEDKHRISEEEGKHLWERIHMSQCLGFHYVQ